MGLIGIIKKINVEPETFWWTACISMILGVIFLIQLLKNESGFSTTMIYLFLFVVSIVVAIGSIKGYMVRKDLVK